MKDLST